MITKLINTIHKVLYKAKKKSLNVNLFLNIILLICFLIMKKYNCKNGVLTVKINSIKCIHADLAPMNYREVFSYLIYLDQFRSIFS